jgi:D-3-phosphoglycerate dehydrogenase
MDVLIVEPLDPEVLHWLGARHAVRYAPELARDPREFRASAGRRARDGHPAFGGVDARRCSAPLLLRWAGCRRAPRTSTSTPARAPASRWCARPRQRRAEAEFAIGALLQMLRRVPVLNAEGLLVGRELGGATVGLVGMTPAASRWRTLLAAFGARVLGYDPARARSRRPVGPLGRRAGAAARADGASDACACC